MIHVRSRLLKKELPSKLREIQEQYPTEQLEVWFQDESRVGQQGTFRIWGMKGSRPRVNKDFRFESAYIFGAVCPQFHKGEAIVVTHVGGEEMTEHLKAISARVAEGARGVVIMDQAPWHKAAQIPNNISIIYLPSYSPELNPVENIWHYLKSYYLSNRVFQGLDDVIDACCQAWNDFCNATNLLQSVAHCDYAMFV